MSSLITLRIQSPNHGTKRIQVEANASLKVLLDEIKKCLQIEESDFLLYKDRLHKEELLSASSNNIQSLGLCHGDMIYLGIQNQRDHHLDIPVEKKAQTNVVSKPTSNTFIRNDLNEEEVDLKLSKMEGKIERKRDEKLCRHNLNGSCVHCSPLEPWNETYLKEHNIKHLSFHSYIRKLKSGADKGKFIALEDLQCRIKPGCREHSPWPKGICSKCQPSAITLNRQIYRHVDNIMFENKHIVEGFLNYWRLTGHQRIGFLYGTYEIQPDVPLGVRARVCAIYEPPQESHRDSILLMDDPHQKEIDEVATALNIKRIGWIFTDLLSDDASRGTVKCTRGIETYFLSAQECIMAGHLQNKHPNICQYASNGYFGSKFVTVCVTGDKKQQIHMEGYAVSAQCMALVRDGCLVPTKDSPALGYIRESSDKQYVPDVYYKEKDVYGNEVQRLGRPLPVEYLLVDIPASTPMQQLYTFTPPSDKTSFPIENRFLEGQVQDINALTNYLSQFKGNNYMSALTDFHLLAFLYKMEMLPMKPDISILFEAVKRNDQALLNVWTNTEAWRTLEQIVLAESGETSSRGNQIDSVSGQLNEDWICNHCTFLNSSGGTNSCEICNLPRS